MNDKLKVFLNYVSENADVAKKFDTLKDEADKDKLISATVAIAKEHGFELTPEDFASDAQELNKDELSSVAGGGDCWCYVGGGGTEEPGNKPCGCVVYGEGNSDDGDLRCACIPGGSGQTL